MGLNITFISVSPSQSQGYLKSTLDQTHLHPYFSFEDGDLVLSTTTADFRVHSREVITRSCALQFMLKTYRGTIYTNGVFHFSNLRGSAEAWACLLGVIYSERASDGPSFEELHDILSVAACYQFDRIRDWALARLRTDFFPNPEYFYVKTITDTITEKYPTLLNACTIYRSPWVPRPPSKLGIELRTLAGYALVRHHPTFLFRSGIKREMTISEWETLCSAKRFMEAEFRATSNAIVTVPFKMNSTVSPGHNAQVCRRMLAMWLADMRREEADVLRALHRLQSDIPLGPVCKDCISEAQFLAREQLDTMCIYLSNCFGIPRKTDWTVTDNVQNSLSRESLLSEVVNE